MSYAYIVYRGGGGGHNDPGSPMSVIAVHKSMKAAKASLPQYMAYYKIYRVPFGEEFQSKGECWDFYSSRWRKGS